MLARTGNRHQAIEIGGSGDVTCQIVERRFDRRLERQPIRSCAENGKQRRAKAIRAEQAMQVTAGDAPVAAGCAVVAAAEAEQWPRAIRARCGPDMDLVAVDGLTARQMRAGRVAQRLV